MSIKFLNLNKTVATIRPTGYKFPVGLSSFLVESNTGVTSTGGTQTYDSSNAVHTFTSNGTFTPSFTGNIEVLVVAGGGGGGGRHAPGAGAGGLIYNSSYPVTEFVGCPVSIGAGGAGSLTGGPGLPNQGTKGTPSIFDGAITAIGGGAGGSGPSPEKNGGSGGGAFSPGDQGTGTPGQGNPGGIGGGTYFGGGGGGAGGAGGNFQPGPQTAGAGGSGATYSISGTPLGYAGGGGGSFYSSGNLGPATDGGGPGGNNDIGVPGTANRGGGGGGGSGEVGGGNGGSGVIIVRYITSSANTENYIVN